MRQSVYLSGPISGRTFADATGWREDAATLLTGAGFRVLDPMRGKSFLSTQKVIEREVYESVHNPILSDKALVNRDYADVMSSDIVLANLHGATAVSIGTTCEVALAHYLHKLVVLVIEPGNVHDHPFIREAGITFNGLSGALDYILSCGHGGAE